MKVTAEEVKLLNLSKAERRLINVLEKQAEAVSVNELSRLLNTPRTSLNWTLKQLLNRKLVSCETRGRQKMWRSNLQESELRKNVASLESFAGDIQIYEGIEKMRAMYNTSLSLHKDERITIIEGKRAARTIAKKAGTEFMVGWHDVVIDKHLIVELIISSRTLRELKAGKINERITKSLSRFTLFVAHVVPDQLLDVDSALFVFRNSLFLADWETERGVLVNNKEIVKMTKNLVEVYKTSGQKIDLLQVIKNL